MTMSDKIGKFGANGLIFIFACGMMTLARWRLDSDAWFILNCGRYVVENGVIPHTEFATMHEGLHYVMEQWLTAVIFWKIYNNFGADGLITFACFVGIILMWIYYKLCLYVSASNQKISLLLSLVICIIISPFIVTRPQIFSSLLLLIEIFLLEKYVRERKIWTLCALPVISAIFINLHSALWVMLIIVIMPVIAESLISKLKHSPDIPLLPLILATLGIILAGFVNPYGSEAMLFLFTSYAPEIHKNIIEVQATTIDGGYGTFYFAFSAMTIVTYSKKIMPIRYFFLTFGLMLLGFYAYRNMFQFFVLGTFTLAYAYKDLQPFNQKFNIKHKLFVPLFLICAVEIYMILSNPEYSIWEMHLPIKILTSCAIIFLLCFIFFYRREGKLFSAELPILRRKPLIALGVFQWIILSSVIYFNFPATDYEPHKPALDFLLKNERAENIILWTGFNSGSYAEFRGVKTYFDARPEIFAISNNHKKDIVTEYFNLKHGQLDYREFFSRYNFTHILVTTEDIIPYLLISNDENYRLLFEYDFSNHKDHGRIFEVVNRNV